MKITKILIHDNLIAVFTLGDKGNFISTLVIIPFLSPDPTINTFPLSCPHPDNCTRIADTFNRADGMTPPNVQANFTQVKEEIVTWLVGQTILNQTADFMHIRWTMPLTRFMDDVMIKLLSGTDSNHTIVWIQSQSRLGSYDFNTNTNRVHSFVDFLTSFNFS